MYIPAYKIKQNKQRQFYLLLSKVIHKYSTCKVDKGPGQCSSGSKV